MNLQHLYRTPLTLFFLILSLLAWLSISYPSQAQEPPPVNPSDNDSIITASTLQQVRLSRPDGKRKTSFGNSVAISDDTLFIAAHTDDEKGQFAGAVYIFQKSASGWSNPTQLAKLTASDGQRSAHFGYSVAVSDDSLVVGAYGGNNGAAYIFQKPVNGSWSNATEIAKLTSNSNIRDLFGISVAISDDTVVVGAPGNFYNEANPAGTVYIFEKPTTGWSTTNTFTARLRPSDSELHDHFGNSVAISDDTVVVGANKLNRKNTAYIFEKPVNGWANTTTETAKLALVDPNQNVSFGIPVAISGDTVVVGDHGSQSAYIFEKPVSGWANTITEAAKLIPSQNDSYYSYLFGIKVAINGDTVVIGDPWNFLPNNNEGRAYIYKRPVGGWASTITESIRLAPSDLTSQARFGDSFAISNDTVFIGAYQVDDRGAVYIYPNMLSAPEITVSGNDNEIALGDTTPTASDHTYFGSTNVSGGTVQRTFTISNTGSADLSVSPISLNGTDAADFSVTQSPTSPVVANDSTSFTIAFDPSATGIRTATVSITNNDADKSPYTFTIQGTGTTITAPEITISGNNSEIISGDTTPTASDHTDFGSTKIDGGTGQRTFTIFNTGNSPLNLNGSPEVSLSGTHASDFTVVTLPASPVPAGGNTSFTIQFDPSATGIRTAIVSITNNDADESPYTFTIQGTGTTISTPEILVSGNGVEITSGDTTPTLADHTDFGNISIDGGSLQRTFTIANTGDALLTFGTLSLSGADAADFSMTQSPSSPVDPNGSTTFTIQFDPESTGIRVATISILNNDVDENPYTFAIQGSGAASAASNSVYLPLISKP